MQAITTETRTPRRKGESYKAVEFIYLGGKCLSLICHNAFFPHLQLSCHVVPTATCITFAVMEGISCHRCVSESPNPTAESIVRMSNQMPAAVTTPTCSQRHSRCLWLPGHRLPREVVRVPLQRHSRLG